MADSIVLVNGVPGSGKTILAAPLAGALGATSLSKDAVKEALAAVTDPRLHSALGAIAMDTVWQLASRVDGLVVVDSWWFRRRDLRYARSGRQAARAKRVVEVWCDVPIEVARVRYERRVRNTVHNDARDLAHEWAAWQAEGRPLAIAPVEIVDTTSAIDVSALAARITRTLDTVQERAREDDVRELSEADPGRSSRTRWCQMAPKWAQIAQDDSSGTS